MCARRWKPDVRVEGLATQVHTANRTGVSTVFTIDHDDFLTYRIHRRRRFRIVPDRW